MILKTTNIDLQNMKKRLNTIEYSLTFLNLDFIFFKPTENMKGDINAKRLVFCRYLRHCVLSKLLRIYV
jgi:hypothetical protein